MKPEKEEKERTRLTVVGNLLYFTELNIRSGSGKMFLRDKCLRFANRHLTPGVDTTLLKSHFAVVTDAVRALRFPVKSNKFPPPVNLLRSFSSFSGFISQTIIP